MRRAPSTWRVPSRDPVLVWIPPVGLRTRPLTVTPVTGPTAFRRRRAVQVGPDRTMTEIICGYSYLGLPELISAPSRTGGPDVALSAHIRACSTPRAYCRPPEGPVDDGFCCGALADDRLEVDGRCEGASQRPRATHREPARRRSHSPGEGVVDSSTPSELGFEDFAVGTPSTAIRCRSRPRSGEGLKRHAPADLARPTPSPAPPGGARAPEGRGGPLRPITREPSGRCWAGTLQGCATVPAPCPPPGTTSGHRHHRACVPGTHPRPLPTVVARFASAGDRRRPRPRLRPLPSR